MNEIPETVKLPSGAVLTLCDPPFEEANELLEAVAVEVGKIATGLKVDLSNSKDPGAIAAQMLAQDLSIDVIKGAACQLVASPIVKAALRRCMGRCLYAGVTMTPASFEPKNARGDYLPAAWEVMRFTLVPFLNGLLSRFSKSADQAGKPPA